MNEKKPELPTMNDSPDELMEKLYDAERYFQARHEARMREMTRQTLICCGSFALCYVLLFGTWLYRLVTQ